MKIDLIEHSTPSVFLFNAICKQFPRDDIRTVLKMDAEGSEADVKLTVNGVEIPFEESINHMWKQMEDSRDERALELAKEVISGSGLQELFDVVKEAEWKIEQVLKKTMATITEKAE